MEVITLDNFFKIMQNFGKIYVIMSDEKILDNIRKRD